MSGSVHENRPRVSQIQAVPPGHEEWLRPTRILGLVAGRAIYRMATYVAGICLLALWGSKGFAAYAAPIGAMGWVLTAVGGTEKAAQTFLPRLPRRELERFFVLAALVPYLLLVLAWVAASVVAADGALTTYLAAAALACGVGGTSAMVALFRMRGRPRLDALTYVHLSAGYVIGIIAVAWLGFDVHQLFMLLLLWQTVAIAILVSRFRGQRLGTGGTATQRREALRVIPLLSAGDLASAVSASILYVELTWGADSRALSTFYVAAVLLTVAAMVWTYLLRLFQPGLVRRLVAGQRDRALQVARRVAASAAVAGLVMTPTLGVAAWWRGDSLLLVAALVVVEPTLYVGASLSTFVLENIDTRARRRAAATAVTELLTVVALGAALAPYRGATGALVAICAGQTVKSAVLFRVLSTTTGSWRVNDGQLGTQVAAAREVSL